MNFTQLVDRFGNEPIIHSVWLETVGSSPASTRQALHRWVKQGRLVQLRRGLYALNAPWRKCPPNRFHLANRLVMPSYVSLQAALDWYGLIPEAAPVVTSITTGRPQAHETPFGRFRFHHVKTPWFTGYREMEIDGQACFMALPEKALLDLVLLTPGGDRASFLRELRLQHLDRIDLQLLRRFATLENSPKLCRAVAVIGHMIDEEEFETL